MANKEQKTRISSSDRKVNASWVNNAVKSLQITGQNTLKSFAPNLYEVTSNVNKTSRDVVTNIRQGKTSVNNITRNIKLRIKENQRLCHDFAGFCKPFIVIKILIYMKKDSYR